MNARTNPTNEHHLAHRKARLSGYFLLAALTMLALSGCVKREVEERNAQAERTRYTPSLYVDDKTGCEYLSSGGRGISPRIAADGKTHMGCKGDKP